MLDLGGGGPRRRGLEYSNNNSCVDPAVRRWRYSSERQSPCDSSFVHGRFEEWSRRLRWQWRSPSDSNFVRLTLGGADPLSELGFCDFLEFFSFFCKFFQVGGITWPPMKITFHVRLCCPKLCRSLQIKGACSSSICLRKSIVAICKNVFLLVIENDEGKKPPITLTGDNYPQHRRPTSSPPCPLGVCKDSGNMASYCTLSSKPMAWMLPLFGQI